MPALGILTLADRPVSRMNKSLPTYGVPAKSAAFQCTVTALLSRPVSNERKSNRGKERYRGLWGRGMAAHRAGSQLQCCPRRQTRGRVTPSSASLVRPNHGTSTQGMVPRTTFRPRPFHFVGNRFGKDCRHRNRLFSHRKLQP